MLAVANEARKHVLGEFRDWAYDCNRQRDPNVVVHVWLNSLLEELHQAGIAPAWLLPSVFIHFRRFGTVANLYSLVASSERVTVHAADALVITLR